MEDYRESASDPDDWAPRGGYEEVHHDPPSSPDAEAGVGPHADDADADVADTDADANDADTAADTDAGSGADLDRDADDAADADADAAADGDVAVDAVVSGLRSRLDAVVGSSRQIAAAEADRLRAIYAMLQEALDNPGVFIPNANGLYRADLKGESEGWVRSSLAQEIGAAMGVTKGHASGLIADAEALCETLPETLEALAVGDISRQHVNAMIRQAITLPDDDAIRAFEAEALPKARRQSPTQFSHAAVKTREGLFPDTITERRAEAVKDRRMDCYGTQDGMGRLSIDAPIEVVHSLHNAAQATARALKAAGDDRTQAQIAVDALVDAIMIGFTQETGAKPGVGAAGLGADRLGGIRPTVHVTVPVMTLLGHENEPGRLDGCGPIDPVVARQLAAQAPSFTRLLTHPETGAVLSVGRDSYKVPADLKRAVQLRDETCVGIGCDRPATVCDLDHVEEWQSGGETRFTNIASECEQHHMIRHHTTWQIRLIGNQVEWTSPLGKHYRVPQKSNVQFVETADGRDDEGVRVDGESASLTTEFPDTAPF